MGEVVVQLANGRSVAFDVNLDSRDPAYFVLGIRKCGSSVVNSMCRMMAAMNHRHYVATDVFFEANVREKDWTNDPAVCELLHPGNIYGGFRTMPAAIAAHHIFRESAKFLMVRDPRDALVSEYFSMAYSHPVPERTDAGSAVTNMMQRLRQTALSSGRDAMVLRRAPLMCNSFLEYVDVARSPGTITVKYEDYIFRKPELIRMLADHFRMAINADQVNLILSEFDKRPDTEDPKAFIRRVTPGDHLEKLAPATIAKLNQILKPAMEAFGYLAR